MADNLARVLRASDGMDPDRLAQELALIAVKIRRDRGNRPAGKRPYPRRPRLLEAGGPVGRRFDFLLQEFNREANTLCSKAGDADLTQTGLDLKVVIDQMREQVQNVE